MIKVSVLYPNSAGRQVRHGVLHHQAHADGAEEGHAPARASRPRKGWRAARPGPQPTYIAAGHLLFDSVEAFQSGFGPHATEIMADIPNYTNTQPVIQISEITL